MKTSTSILLGCLLIAAAIVMAGNIIGNTIANNLGAAAANMPGSFTMYDGNQQYQTGPSSEYMSDWEASQYCRIDYDAFIKLLGEGKLKGTYIEIPVEKVVEDAASYETAQPVPDSPAQAEAVVTPSQTVPPPVVTVPGVELVFIRVKLDEWMLAQLP